MAARPRARMRAPQAGVSGLSGGRIGDETKRAKTAAARGFAACGGERADQEWALDFAHDAAESGRSFRVLSMLDVYTRECLALEVDTGFAGRRVRERWKRSSPSAGRRGRSL